MPSSSLKVVQASPQGKIGRKRFSIVWDITSTDIIPLQVTPANHETSVFGFPSLEISYPKAFDGTLQQETLTAEAPSHYELVRKSADTWILTWSIDDPHSQLPEVYVNDTLNPGTAAVTYTLKLWDSDGGNKDLTGTISIERYDVNTPPLLTMSASTVATDPLDPVMQLEIAVQGAWALMTREPADALANYPDPPTRFNPAVALFHDPEVLDDMKLLADAGVELPIETGLTPQVGPEVTARSRWQHRVRPLVQYDALGLHGNAVAIEKRIFVQGGIADPATQELFWNEAPAYQLYRASEKVIDVTAITPAAPYTERWTITVRPSDLQRLRAWGPLDRADGNHGQVRWDLWVCAKVPSADFAAFPQERSIAYCQVNYDARSNPSPPLAVFTDPTNIGVWDGSIPAGQRPPASGTYNYDVPATTANDATCLPGTRRSQDQMDAVHQSLAHQVRLSYRSSAQAGAARAAYLPAWSYSIESLRILAGASGLSGLPRLSFTIDLMVNVEGSVSEAMLGNQAEFGGFINFQALRVSGFVPLLNQQLEWTAEEPTQSGATNWKRFRATFNLLTDLQSVVIVPYTPVIMNFGAYAGPSNNVALTSWWAWFWFVPLADGMCVAYYRDQALRTPLPVCDGLPTTKKQIVWIKFHYEPSVGADAFDIEEVIRQLKAVAAGGRFGQTRLVLDWPYNIAPAGVTLVSELVDEFRNGNSALPAIRVTLDSAAGWNTGGTVTIGSETFRVLSVTTLRQLYDVVQLDHWPTNVYPAGTAVTYTSPTISEPTDAGPIYLPAGSVQGWVSGEPVRLMRLDGTSADFTLLCVVPAGSIVQQCPSDAFRDLVTVAEQPASPFPAGSLALYRGAPPDVAVDQKVRCWLASAHEHRDEVTQYGVGAGAAPSAGLELQYRVDPPGTDSGSFVAATRIDPAIWRGSYDVLEPSPPGNTDGTAQVFVKLGSAAAAFRPSTLVQNFTPAQAVNYFGVPAGATSTWADGDIARIETSGGFQDFTIEHIYPAGTAVGNPPFLASYDIVTVLERPNRVYPTGASVTIVLASLEWRDVYIHPAATECATLDDYGSLSTISQGGQFRIDTTSPLVRLWSYTPYRPGHVGPKPWDVRMTFDEPMDSLMGSHVRIVDAASMLVADPIETEWESETTLRARFQFPDRAPEAVYRVCVSNVFDCAGNELVVPDCDAIVRDRTPPAIASYEADPPVISAIPGCDTVLIRFTLTEPSDPAATSVLVGTRPAIRVYASQDGAKFVFQYTAKGVEPEGPTDVTIRARDSADNTGDFVVDDGVILDFTSPAIAFVRPATEGETLSGTPLDVQATWTDLNGVALDTATVLLNGEDVTTQCVLTPDGFRFVRD